MRVAIQVKDLISSNVTHAVDTASNPAKLLHKLQREIEEAIISLAGERTRVTQKIKRYEASLTQNELREADWGGKARTAMDHGREDLARQALMAREDCRETIAELKQNIETAKAELAEIDDATGELEAKREETRAQAKAQAAADSDAAALGGSGAKGSKAESHLNRISTLEKRAQFAAEDTVGERVNAAVDRDIEEMRRASAIDAELAAMKAPAAPAKAARKKAK